MSYQLVEMFFSPTLYNNYVEQTMNIGKMFTFVDSPSSIQGDINESYGAAFVAYSCECLWFSSIYRSIRLLPLSFI